MNCTRVELSSENLLIESGSQLKNDANKTVKGCINEAAIYGIEDGSESDVYETEEEIDEEAFSTIDPAEEPVPDTFFRIFQQKLRKVIEHFIFRLFGFILIIVDICIVIVELVYINEPAEVIRPYEIVSLTLVTCFVVEILLRITALGLKGFFSNWYNTIDIIIVTCTFIINILYTLVDLIDVPGEMKLVVAGRLIRIAIIVRLYTEKKNVEKGARHMVSQNKRRYQKDGFDLDLTYVTERVIAMSFPSAGKMSIYRNPIKEVARFFETRHPEHYKLYNLCSERSYDDSFFQGRVERFLIDDHNVPLLHDMVRFVKSVRSWMADDPSNVIAVHCKGGKGRTGTMICVWLVESGLFESAKFKLFWKPKN